MDKQAGNDHPQLWISCGLWMITLESGSWSTGRDGGFTAEDSREHGRNHGDGETAGGETCIYSLLDLADPGRSRSQTIHIENIEVIYEHL